jgi:hypothetical protein
MIRLFHSATQRRVCSAGGPERIDEGHVSTMIQGREAVTFSTPATRAARVDWLGMPGEGMVSPCARQPSWYRAPAQGGHYGAQGVRHGTTFVRREQIMQPAAVSEARDVGAARPLTRPRKMVAGARFDNLTQGGSCTTGFGIHAGHTARRFHDGPLEQPRLLDSGEADFVEVKK